MTNSDLRGRQPVAFLAQHLVEPLASVLARDRGIEVDGSGTIAAVLADPNIVERLSEPRERKRSKTGLQKTARKKADSPDEDEVADEEEEADFQEEAEEEAEPYVGNKAMEGDDKDTLDADEERSASPPPQPKPPRHHPNRVESSDSGSPPPSKQPSRAKPARNRTPPPDKPTPSPSPVKASQKSKREKEENEEEEVEKRREEMRRRMGAGAGGKLGKRRFGR